MNNNINNEQDLILKEKIEKREKFDTILAYILLVVLLICIGLVVLVKLNKDKEEDKPPVEEYTPTYISLGEISSSLNSSNLVAKYPSFTTSINDNGITITYSSNDTIKSQDIPVVGNEIVLTYTAEDSSFAIDLYKEIANTICMYYGNEENHCRNTTKNLNTNTDGIRFETAGDNNVVYITTTKSIPVSTEEIYTETTVTDINNNNYRLELGDVTVSQINVVTTDTNLSVTGTVESTITNLSVSVKLYNTEDNLLGENKYEYNEENPLNQTGLFQIDFILSDTLKLEDISKYSIEIIK